MPDDISVQLLTQASENINKLYDLVTRIDERLKAVKETQGDAETKITVITQSYNEIVQRVASLESSFNSVQLHLDKISECEKLLNDIDKRLSAVEDDSNTKQDRWNKVISFVIQLAWVILAAWLLTKLNLQSPAVP